MDLQTKDQIIDVSNWQRDEELATYPEGARDKTLIYSSDKMSYSFLIPNHNYLFKLSSNRAPEQYWIEIFAYRLGLQTDIPVPPTFVSYDSKKNISGALVEWFVDDSAKGKIKTYIPGGDYFQSYISDFDRKKGRKHNIETIIKIFEDLEKEFPEIRDTWMQHWAKTLVFDALIGNTDRHQDNWGIIKNSSDNTISIAPVFDNGTSLGYEILSEKFGLFDNDEHILKYISNGWHHVKWSENDELQWGHLELLQKLVVNYPETRAIMLHCLHSVDDTIFTQILEELITYDVPVRLTSKRAAFMLKLLSTRYERLLRGLES